MCLEKNFQINRLWRLFWSTVRLRGIKYVLNCEISYLESLEVFDIMTVYFRTDLLLLWKILNGFIDSNLSATFVCSTSRAHHFGHYEISKNKKFRMDEHFLNRSQRAANHLMRMKIINFDIL